MKLVTALLLFAICISATASTVESAPRVMLTTIDDETIDLGELYEEGAAYLKFRAMWRAD